MVLSPRERPGLTSFRGLEQFHLRGNANGVGYCIAGAKPYALEFSNSADVICLLLGDINSNSKFEDDREKPLVFLGDSTAFHPRVGNVRVRAADVLDLPHPLLADHVDAQGLGRPAHVQQLLALGQDDVLAVAAIGRRLPPVGHAEALRWSAARTLQPIWLESAQEIFGPYPRSPEVRPN